MSIESMAIALHHSQAKGTDKLVLLGICNHDGDGGAWPSHETLGKYANCGLTRVKQAIKTLVALREISVKSRAGGDLSTRNDRRPNLYEVILTCPSSCNGSTKHRLTRVTPSDCRDEGDDSHFSAQRQSLLDLTTVTPSACEPPIYKPSIKTESVSNKSNAGDLVAKQWWEAQHPKPAGKGAWFALLNACRAVAEKGWTNDQILTALNKLAAVPSVPQLDRELRNPRVATWAERKANEEREEADKIALRRQREYEETERRRQAREEDAAKAVPPTPEFREAIKRMKSNRS